MASHLYDFQGKRVLVTGAGRGIGRHIAKAISAAGGHVIALSRSPGTLQTLKDEDSRIETVVCDLADWPSTRDVVTNLGDVDMLVNNAGIMAYSPTLDVTEQHFDQQFTLNVKAAWHVSQIVVGNLMKRGSPGSIVNMSSVGSHSWMSGCSVYSMTKAAMDQMTKVMAAEFGSAKIRVNAVNPGLVEETGMGDEACALIPGLKEKIATKAALRDVVNKDDVANGVMFLLNDQSSRMVTGTCLDIAGG